jgi:hypothetical protein
MEMMNEYNITAQVINKDSFDKQTILFNDCVESKNIKEAAEIFNKQYKDIYNILKIYSITQVN